MVIVGNLVIVFGQNIAAKAKCCTKSPAPAFLSATVIFIT